MDGVRQKKTPSAALRDYMNSPQSHCVLKHCIFVNISRVAFNLYVHVYRLIINEENKHLCGYMRTQNDSTDWTFKNPQGVPYSQ